MGMGFWCLLWCIKCVMGQLGSWQQGISHNSSQWEMDILDSWAVTSGVGAQKMCETEVNWVWLWLISWFHIIELWNSSVQPPAASPLILNWSCWRGPSRSFTGFRGSAASSVIDRHHYWWMWRAAPQQRLQKSQCRRLINCPSINHWMQSLAWG